MGHVMIQSTTNNMMLANAEMHELSITESILEIAIRHGKQVNASRISDLFLVIGGLSSVVDESVQFYWDFISEGTIAEGAQLHFRRIPTELVCQECDSCYSPDTNLTCPLCNSNKIRIKSGQEFYLESIGIVDAALN